MDKLILQELYRKYSRELYLYLCSLSHDPGLSEDLLQETFLKALLSLSESHTNMRAWLYLVARNLYFNHVKKRQKDCPMDALEGQADERDRGILEQTVLDEEKRFLYEGIGKLTAKKREVIILQYFGGFSQKEIAAMMHITPENVRVLASRGKRELRSYMEGKGYDVP